MGRWVRRGGRDKEKEEGTACAQPRSWNPGPGKTEVNSGWLQFGGQWGEWREIRLESCGRNQVLYGLPAWIKGFRICFESSGEPLVILSREGIQSDLYWSNGLQCGAWIGRGEERNRAASQRLSQ